MSWTDPLKLYYFVSISLRSSYSAPPLHKSTGNPVTTTSLSPRVQERRKGLARPVYHGYPPYKSVNRIGCPRFASKAALPLRSLS